MTLDKAKRGQQVIIESIPDDRVRAQAIRFGITEGEMVTCCEVVPAGPIVLSRNRQEIAVGRRLAGRIQVRLLEKSQLSPRRPKYEVS